MGIWSNCQSWLHILETFPQPQSSSLCGWRCCAITADYVGGLESVCELITQAPYRKSITLTFSGRWHRIEVPVYAAWLQPCFNHVQRRCYNCTSCTTNSTRTQTQMFRQPLAILYTVSWITMSITSNFIPKYMGLRKTWATCRCLFGSTDLSKPSYSWLQLILVKLKEFSPTVSVGRTTKRDTLLPLATITALPGWASISVYVQHSTFNIALVQLGYMSCDIE